MTHDNPSVLHKYQTGRMALPHIGLSSLADLAIASTWGYDLLLPEQIHCVEETRIYPALDQRSFVTKDDTIFPNIDREQVIKKRNSEIKMK